MPANHQRRKKGTSCGSQHTRSVQRLLEGHRGGGRLWVRCHDGHRHRDGLPCDGAAYSYHCRQNPLG